MAATPGGTVFFTWPGNITQANNAPLVGVGGGHTGTLTFPTGTLSAANGTGLQFDNAAGTASYNVNGTTTLNGGDAGIDITNGSSGTFNFGANVAITNPSGTAFTLNGSNANVTYSGGMSKLWEPNHLSEGANASACRSRSCRDPAIRSRPACALSPFRQAF